RIAPLLAAVEKMGIDIAKPRDHGMTMIGRAHDLGYLRFLESAHRRWPKEWGDEVLSNIFVRSPNPMHGVLAEAAHYIADGSSPIGPRTWEAAYWSAQSALTAADDIIGGEQFAYGLCRPPGHHARPDAAGRLPRRRTFRRWSVPPAWSPRPPGRRWRFLFPEQCRHCRGGAVGAQRPRRHSGSGYAPRPGHSGMLLRS